MNASFPASHAAPQYRGDDKLILGIVLAVVTFWLFAQTTLNIAPAMRDDLRITEAVSTIAVSITALFSGIFIVIAGGLADRLGRLKLTNVGIVLSIIGSLLIALSPAGTGAFLMVGRVVQGMTPSTDAALSNVPEASAGSASGIYKMASSLGAALGVAISAAIFAGLSHLEGLGAFAEIAMGRTDNINVRFAASVALMFNVFMVAVGLIAIMVTVPGRAAKN